MAQPLSQGFIHAVLLDGFLQSFLLGTILVQGFQYWSDSKHDSRLKRMFVAIVMLLSLLQTVLEDYKVWRSFTSKLRWSTSRLQWSDFFLNGCICSMCQAFYIGRCWILTGKRRWILYPFSTLLAVTFVANIYLAIVIGIAFSGRGAATNDLLNVSRNLLPSTITAFTLWMSGTLALDVGITVTAAVALWRSKTGLLQSDRVVHRIIMVTWESAALPSICTIVSAALYFAEPYSYDHVVILLVLQTGKLYALGMLRTLNLRARLGQKLRAVDLGGRTSLRSWTWEASSLARTSTTRDSFPFPESPKSYERPAPELSDTLVHWPCHCPPARVEEQQATYSEIHFNPCSPEIGMPRNRINSRRSSYV